MRTYRFTLNCEVDAFDQEQVLEIAEACKKALLNTGPEVPWIIKVVEIDDVEEA